MNHEEFFSKLSDELKAKIKACQTREEMMDLLKSEKIDLDPDVLETVSGGGRSCIGYFCTRNRRSQRDDAGLSGEALRGSDF